MKLFLFLTLVTSYIHALRVQHILTAQPVQKDARVRKSWQSMSILEKQKSLRSMYAAYSSGALNQWAKLHAPCSSRFAWFAHDSINGPFATLAHRAYVWTFEDVVRKFDPHFTVPYWDILSDAEDYAHDPEGDFMQMTGGRKTSCVRLVPGSACLKVQGVPVVRDFQQRFPIMRPELFHSAALQYSLMLETAYLDPSNLFQNNLAFPEAAGCLDVATHLNVGGSMDNTPSKKANCSDENTIDWSKGGDPIQVMHHAGLDMFGEYAFSLSRPDLRELAAKAWNTQQQAVYGHVHPRFPGTTVGPSQMLFQHPVEYEKPSWWNRRMSGDLVSVSMYLAKCRNFFEEEWHGWEKTNPLLTDDPKFLASLRSSGSFPCGYESKGIRNKCDPEPL